MPRKRVYEKTSDRYLAYHHRKKVLRADLAALKEALTQAGERKGSRRLMERLPEEPAEWVPELTRRLQSVNVVTHRRSD